VKINVFFFLLLSFSIIMGNNNLRTINKNSSNSKKSVFCALKHSPGVNWKEGVPFQEQPGVEEHIKYMSEHLANGILLMGGPFLDNSGGMMVCRTSDIAKAKEIAEADPEIKSGLLKVEVKRWMVPMSSVDLSPQK
jgi:uncharacterized protein YciI